jgi:hypothetical protein
MADGPSSISRWYGGFAAASRPDDIDEQGMAHRSNGEQHPRTLGEKMKGALRSKASATAATT